MNWFILENAEGRTGPAAAVESSLVDTAPTTAAFGIPLGIGTKSMI